MTTVETKSPVAEDIEELRRDVAVGCRIAGHRGLCEDILGHISVRSGDGLLIRCRGPRESGLLFTQLEDVRLAAYDGALLEVEDGFTVPNEIHIHTEVLKARPEINAVFNAQPPAIVAERAAGGQVAERPQPAGAVLAGGDLDAEDLVVPVGVDSGGHEGVDRHDPAAPRTHSPRYSDVCVGESASRTDLCPPPRKRGCSGLRP